MSAPKNMGFLGTENPRHLRAITALQLGRVSREQLDQITGSSNSPQLVSELRARGLELPCSTIRAVDRDGNICHPGIYHLTDLDRNKLQKWQDDGKFISSGPIQQAGGTA